MHTFSLPVDHSDGIPIQMDVDPTLRFAFYSSGLLAPKVGALHLALLSRLLSSPMREHHRKILYDLRADLNVCLAFIRRGPDSRPVGSSAWQTMLSTVFAKVVTRLESMESYRSFFGAEGVGGWSPGEGNRRRQFSQSAMQVLMNPKGLVVFGLEASEIERVHFRKDVTLGGPDEWTFIEAAGTLETRWKGN